MEDNSYSYISLRLTKLCQIENYKVWEDQERTSSWRVTTDIDSTKACLKGRKRYLLHDVGGDGQQARAQCARARRPVAFPESDRFYGDEFVRDTRKQKAQLRRTNEHWPAGAAHGKYSRSVVINCPKSPSCLQIREEVKTCTMGKGTKEKPKDKSSKGKDDDGEVENVKVCARIAVSLSLITREEGTHFDFISPHFTFRSPFALAPSISEKRLAMRSLSSP